MCATRPPSAVPSNTAAVRCHTARTVVQVLEKWRAGGHKALLFTQTQQMLDIIERHVAAAGMRYLRMDGSVPPQHRFRMIDHFNRHPARGLAPGMPGTPHGGGGAGASAEADLSAPPGDVEAAPVGGQRDGGSDDGPSLGPGRTGALAPAVSVRVWVFPNKMLCTHLTPCAHTAAAGDNLAE